MVRERNKAKMVDRGTLSRGGGGHIYPNNLEVLIIFPGWRELL